MAVYTKSVSSDGFVSERYAVHRDRMLGSYDNGGKYTISDKIVKELMQMRKVKKHTYDNSLFCIADILGLGEITFEVKYEKKAVGQKASSQIFVLENVYKVNGYYINTMRTKIGEYVSTVDNYIQKSYDYYNISLVDDEDGRDKINDHANEYPYIHAKKEYEGAMYRTISKDMEKAYKKFYDTAMDIIRDNGGDYATRIAEKYDSEYNAINSRFLTANGDNNHVAYNELLNKVIEDLDGINPEYDKQSKALYASLEKPIIDLAKDYTDCTMNAEKQVKKTLTKDSLEKVDELQQEVIDRNRFVKKSSAWDNCITFDEISAPDMVKQITEKKNNAKALADAGDRLKGIAKRRKDISMDM